MEEKRFKELYKAMQNMVDVVQGKEEPDNITTVITYDVKAIRGRTGLTQAQFAKVLGVGVRTLQEWEQGNEVPFGPYRSLLNVAFFYPQELIDSYTKMNNMVELEDRNNEFVDKPTLQDINFKTWLNVEEAAIYGVQSGRTN